MRKYIVALFVLVSCTLLTNNGFAQRIFAGGDIFAKYVGDGSETCSEPHPYQIKLQFFRDAPIGTIDPLPLTTTVWIVDVTSSNPSNWNPLPELTLDSLQVIPTLDNICITDNTILTDGGFYSNTQPVLLDPNKKYKILFGEQVPGGFSYIGYEFHSPSNANINQGQRFFLKTEVNTFCDTITTLSADTPPDEEVVYDLGKNQAPIWNAKTEILETLCEGNSYRYNLRDYVSDPVTTTYTIRDRVSGTPVGNPVTVKDSLSFRLKPVVTAENRAAIYINPRSTYDPFPTSASNPFTFNEGTGVMTFTPELAVGERIYTAPLVVEVTEWRRTYTLEGDGNGNNIRRVKWEIATISTRQLRFLIGDQQFCDDNLPQIVANNNTGNEQIPGEYDCAARNFSFSFTKPMLYRSIAFEAPFDFRVFRGTNPKAPIDQSAYNPDGIIIDPSNVNQFGEFTDFTLFFEDGLGPGTYTIFTRLGNDTNTVENRCGFFMPEFQSTTFVVGRKYDYIFKEDDDKIAINSQKNFCFPGDAPFFNLDALAAQSKAIVQKADSFHFKFKGANPFGPATLVDSFQLNNSKFNTYNTITIPDPYDYDITPLGKETEGYWTVGVGLNFPWYTFSGVTNDERCYGEDFTLVEYFTHPEVTTVDIDLCREERWPVIKDLIDPKYTIPGSSGNPVSYFWRKIRDSVRTVLATDPSGVVIGFPGDVVVYDTIAIGGSSNTNSQAAGNVNDTLDLEGVATGVGPNSLQKIEVRVVFPNGCETNNEIQIVKQDVNVELGPEIVEEFGIRDTIICRDEVFNLYNTLSDEYLRPDYMSRQWYYGEENANMILQNETSDTLSTSSMLQNGRGWYKLIVTKTTENSICFGSDSIYINIADSLVITNPECSKVTFDADLGEVRQRFFWPPVAGADWYEVRGIDVEGNPLDSSGTKLTPGGEVVWYRANYDFGINHRIFGKEVRLLVRAVNGEVEEGTSCKYGEPAMAEACEVVVKPTNIFTPNGDGINDLLRFDLLELYDGNKLQIYNRWGKLMFESSNYQNDWDGGDLKDGTYFYVLDIDDPRGLQDIFKGTITILR